MSTYTIDRVTGAEGGPTAEFSEHLQIAAPDGRVIQRVWYHPAMEEPAMRVAEAWVAIYGELGHPEGYFRDSVINTPDGDPLVAVKWNIARRRAHAGDTAQ
jgi:hypothetical protein